MAAFATPSELQARLDFDLVDNELGEDLTAIAQSALDDLSEDARSYGSTAWVDNASAPAIVKSIVLRAATRYVKNLEGATTSRAADETIGWEGDKHGMAGSPYFSDREIQQIQQIRDEENVLDALGSFGTYGHSVTPDRNYRVWESVNGREFAYEELP